MLEKDVEHYLKTGIEKKIPGARCWKFVSPGLRGVPDRIILLPGAKVVFAELKKPGKKPGPLQRYVHGLIERLGFEVFGCVDTKEKADAVIRHCYFLVYEWPAFVRDIWAGEEEHRGS